MDICVIDLFHVVGDGRCLVVVPIERLLVRVGSRQADYLDFIVLAVGFPDFQAFQEAIRLLHT
jgi:hypothetical protein